MTKRRGRGEGSIYRRHNHPDCPPIHPATQQRPEHTCRSEAWEASIDLGRNSEGKRLRKTVYGTTKREVQSKLKDAERLRDSGLPQRNENLRISQWLDQWLANVQISDRTRETYTYSVTNNLKPTIGGLKLASLSPRHVEVMCEALLDRGLSLSTVLQARRTLSTALNAAMRDDVLSRNVASLSKPPKGRTESRADLALSFAEAASVVGAAAGNRLEALAIVLLTLGLRRGEALALRWENIALDDDDPVLSVEASLGRVSGKGLIRSTTKTVGSERTIPLVEPALSALREHRVRQNRERHAAEVWLDPGIVFATEHGQYIDPRNALRVWHGWTESAGLGKRRMHAGRHTAATLLLAGGIPLEVVSAVLGHASIRITSDTYAKVGRDAQRRALASVKRLA